MNIHSMLKKSGQWLQCDGPESDIVISSRVRLARNLQEFPFQSKSTEESATAIIAKVNDVLDNHNSIEKLPFEQINALPSVTRKFLVERHLISKELSKSERPCGVAFNAEESISIMVNEEDHLRIQAISSGLLLDECFERANLIDNMLEHRLNYSFSAHFGYLTACPTNVGTGLRASVMLHLPALSLTNQIEKVYHSLAKLNLVVRGLFGEGTTALGDFYQISNQATLNRSETKILESLQRIIPNILQYERSIRENLITTQGKALEDKLWRSLAILKYARKLKLEETLDCLSAVRLGLHIGVISGIDSKVINDLFILCQPAHLKIQHEEDSDDTDVSVLRANLIRQYLETI